MSLIIGSRESRGRDLKGRGGGRGIWGEAKGQPREWGETKRKEKRAKGIGARRIVSQGSGVRLKGKRREHKELRRDE